MSNTRQKKKKEKKALRYKILPKHTVLQMKKNMTYDGCTVAPLTDYINSPVYQELSTESDYFSYSDERIYIDLRASYSHTRELEKFERNNSKLTQKLN